MCGEGQLVRVQLLWNQEIPLSPLPSILGILGGSSISCFTYLLTLFSISLSCAWSTALVFPMSFCSGSVLSSISLAQEAFCRIFIADLPPAGPVCGLLLCQGPHSNSPVLLHLRYLLLPFCDMSLPTLTVVSLPSLFLGGLSQS